MAEGDAAAAPKTPSAKIDAPPADAQTVDLTGKVLGEFKLLRKLGRGGMAEVYLAEQTSLRRNVAVKVLRSEFTSDANYLRRFQQEATAAGTLSHPNIVQVYLIGEQDGVHFIAQEYVQGRNLKEFLARKGPLDLPVALVILKQVAAALQVAGAAGVVHRDIKPENILLNKKGEAKVADFGLAQLTLQGEKVALTQVGVTMGTPLYMSPEQVNGKPLDIRSDLYSFGVMAYHMLAGKPPFQGESPLAIAVQHLNSQCPPLKSVRPDLPDAVCEFVHKLMAKKRDDRYPDAQTVLQELKQLSRLAAGKEPLADTVLERTSTTKTRRVTGRQVIWDLPWRKQLLWLIPLCLVSAAGAAGAGWLLRVQDPFLTPAPEPKARTFDKPAAQYYYALFTKDDPAVWIALIDKWQFDKSAEVEVGHAELHLAMIDLRAARLEEAKAKFDKMLKDGEQFRNNWKRTHGKAGLAIVYSLEGRVEESRKLLDEVRNDVRSSKEPLDAVMDDALEVALRQNSSR